VISTFASGFASPQGLAFDASGNLYVANDTVVGTVSKVTPGGVVSTFATGFSAPKGLAFDASGNLYVGNYNNTTVNKVTPAGVVSTFATGFINPSGLAFAVRVAPDAYQLRYFANTGIGDQYIDISNSGVSGAGLMAGTTATIAGAICVNAYVFAPDEQLMACCSCPVTPNGATRLSVQNDLLNNVLEPQLTVTGITVALTATAPVAGSCSGAAYAAIPTIIPFTTLAPGLIAWGTTLHANTSLVPAAYQETETSFEVKVLGATEAERLTELCLLNTANGSGAGICNSCQPGALSASKK
jgi:hypothetical protein